MPESLFAESAKVTLNIRQDSPLRQHLPLLKTVVFMRHPKIEETEDEPSLENIEASMALAREIISRFPQPVSPRDGLIIMSPSKRVTPAVRGFADLRFKVLDPANLMQDKQGFSLQAHVIAPDLIHLVESERQIRILIVICHGPQISHLPAEMLPDCRVLPSIDMNSAFYFDLVERTCERVTLQPKEVS